MPTILHNGPYRFYFYSHEPNEPAHTHIDRQQCSAKFWLHDAALARNVGFSSRELGVLRRLVIDNKRLLLEAWNEFFDQD